MVTYDQFKVNYEGLQARIRQACAQCSRNPASVRLLPVTKTNPVEAAIWAYQSGIRSVAENRVQEAESKRLSAPAELRW